MKLTLFTIHTFYYIKFLVIIIVLSPKQDYFRELGCGKAQNLRDKLSDSSPNIQHALPLPVMFWNIRIFSRQWAYLHSAHARVFESLVPLRWPPLDSSAPGRPLPIITPSAHSTTPCPSSKHTLQVVAEAIRNSFIL